MNNQLSNEDSEFPIPMADPKMSPDVLERNFKKSFELYTENFESMYFFNVSNM